jgi:hypothetical protein
MMGNKNNEGVRMLSLFVGMMASICWIFAVMLFPAFFSARGEIMPYDRWIIIAAGLAGAVASFFAAMGIVRGIALLADRFRKDKTK